MAIEIEKKFRLTEAQKQAVSVSLKEIGAEHIGDDFEENILFSNRELLKKQAVLRLRRIDERIILTYKQKLENDSAAKQHIEHETEVADFEAIEKIVEALGFHRSLIYEKRRETWKFGAVEIVLDVLPFGLFMEIEGALTAIVEAEKLLGADEFEVEPLTYPNLTIKYGTKKGGLIEARFD